MIGRTREPPDPPAYHEKISISAPARLPAALGVGNEIQRFRSRHGQKTDKTRIFLIPETRPPPGSTVMHRERHSGHPWRWIECAAGIGPHGAAAVVVARCVLRSPSPFRWRWA